MQVVATRMGYYGERRYREGQRFILSDPKHFSHCWMQKIGQDGHPIPNDPKKKFIQTSHAAAQDTKKKLSDPSGYAVPGQKIHRAPAPEPAPAAEPTVSSNATVI